MRILFVTSEAYPLIKTGGLADVSGSLPAALNGIGADVRVLIPGYPAVLTKLQNLRPLITIGGLPYIESADILIGNMPDTGVSVMAIKAPSLYERDGGPYINTAGKDWPDNAIRFGILSRIAAILSNSDSPISAWVPDIVHCNDWQSGLTPAFMHYMRANRTEIHHAKSMISIHNLAFQGNFGPEWVTNLGLPQSSYHMHGLEYYGNMSFLKAGIYYADSLSTVSPTYAKEIQTAEFGFGMQGLLSSRSHELHGILNGIDTEEWNPETDQHLQSHYNWKKLKNKALVKSNLQARLGLTASLTTPLLGVVSRLTDQKGLDMFQTIAAQLLEEGCQIALLGSGEAMLEKSFMSLTDDFPNKVSVNIGYNEELSHQIMSGADIFIMPSRFEPCGLNQMYGLRYGTPSVVANTGGLADSITNTTEESLSNDKATGFIMAEKTTESLYSTIKSALSYYENPTIWEKIQRNCMQKDVSWKTSANAYINLYKSML